MINSENEIKTETIRQNYDYTFLSDILEMLRGNCCFINCDKKLNRLFTAIINYVNSHIPVIDDEIIDFCVSVTVKK